jgi:hypothetical protein
MKIYLIWQTITQFSLPADVVENTPASKSEQKILEKKLMKGIQ